MLQLFKDVQNWRKIEEKFQIFQQIFFKEN